VLWVQTAVKSAAIAYDQAELGDTQPSTFSPDTYFPRLSNQRLGHTLLTAASVASTQVLLKEYTPAAPPSPTLPTADSRRPPGLVSCN
jgi:hypothetical protein